MSNDSILGMDGVKASEMSDEEKAAVLRRNVEAMLSREGVRRLAKALDIPEHFVWAEAVWISNQAWRTASTEAAQASKQGI